MPPGYLFRKLTVVHQWLNPLWTFRTSGVKITDPRRPYIVVANHQSFVDILLISHLPWEMKWLSKEDFFKYPLVGWLMRMAGDIKLIRGKRDSIVAAMDSCKDRLSKHVSVMIFPEGTRSTDGEVPQVQGRGVPLGHRDGHAHPARWCSTAPILRCRKATGDSGSPTQRCACSTPSRPPA